MTLNSSTGAAAVPVPLGSNEMSSTSAMQTIVPSTTLATLTAIPNDSGSSSSMTLQQRPSIDVYSPVGMQRLGHLYKSTNSYIGSGGINKSNNSRNSDSGKSEQNAANVQQIVESAIG